MVDHRPGRKGKLGRHIERVTGQAQASDMVALFTAEARGGDKGMLL